MWTRSPAASRRHSRIGWCGCGWPPMTEPGAEPGRGIAARALAAGLMAAGLAVLGAFWLGTRPAPVSAQGADAPGPYLDIAVAGAAEGRVVIDLAEEAAPAHAARLIALAEAGEYDGIVFHRVIDGFMAQTGDVRFGVAGEDLSRAGTGGSDLPDLPAEFSDIPFERGTVGMARA